jgi:hypothetical protein
MLTSTPFPRTSRHHQHAKRGGGMRRVDSLELHRARLPESARRGSRRKSQLGAPEKANAPGGTFSGGLLSLLGLGSSPAAVLRS